MLPVAPGLFSTTTGCLYSSESFWPTARARMSEVPPGGYGTMILRGFEGQACPKAAPATAKDKAANAAAIRFKFFSSVDLGFGSRGTAFEEVEVATLVGLRDVLEIQRAEAAVEMRLLRF